MTRTFRPPWALACFSSSCSLWRWSQMSNFEWSFFYFFNFFSIFFEIKKSIIPRVWTRIKVNIMVTMPIYTSVLIPALSVSKRMMSPPRTRPIGDHLDTSIFVTKNYGSIFARALIVLVLCVRVRNLFVRMDSSWWTRAKNWSRRWLSSTSVLCHQCGCAENFGANSKKSL